VGHAVAFSPDSRQLVTAHRDEFRLWAVPITAGGSWEPVRSFRRQGELNTECPAAFSRAGVLALATTPRAVKLFDANTGSALAQLQAPNPEMLTWLEFSPDGSRLAATTQGRSVHLWNLAGLRRELAALKLDWAGPPLAPSATADEPLRARFAGEVRRYVGRNSFGPRAHLSPDGRVGLLAFHTQRPRAWDLATDAEAGKFPPHPTNVSDLAACPDGRHVVTACWDGKARLCDLQTGLVEREFPDQADRLNAVAVAAKGRRVLAAGGVKNSGKDFRVRVWDLIEDRPTGFLTGHTNSVWGLAVSADGKLGLSGSDDFTARLWDLDDCRELWAYKSEKDYCPAVDLSPDGRFAAVGSFDQTVRILDIRTGKPVHPQPLRHTGAVECVCFSSDSRRLASAGADRTVRLWNVETGAELACFFGHDETIYSVAFTPDGNRLLTASGDGTIRLWELPPANPTAPPNNPGRPAPP
jgi:WD40 repeat protein